MARFVYVKVAPGVITMLPAWMLDRVGCGAPISILARATVTALIDLHQLLIERGFRGNFPDDSEKSSGRSKMRNAPKSVPPPPAPPTVPRQHGIAFDSIQLRGMIPTALNSDLCPFSRSELIDPKRRWRDFHLVGTQPFNLADHIPVEVVQCQDLRFEIPWGGG